MLIELSDGKRRVLTLSGIPYRYISQETLERLTGIRGYNRLSVVAATNRMDVAHLQDVAERVRDKVADYGLRMTRRQIPPPGVHPLNSLI